MLDDRRVRYLYEAVLAGSVRAAADKLDMNPSVVSRQIAQLESELSITLLERHGRGVKVTDAGQILVDYYRQHRSNQDDVLAKFQAIRGLSHGHVDLVLGEGFVSDLMARPLEEFWRNHPGLTVTLNLAGTNDVLRQVVEDIAHIGLVYNPPVTPRIRSRAVVRQPMCVIVAPQHPITKAGQSPTLRQLASYDVAVMHGSYGTRQIIELAEQVDKVRLNPKLTTNSISVIKHFVRADLGVSLLPAFAVSQEIATGELAAIPIEHQMLSKAEAHIVTRLGRQLSPAANQLLLQLIATMEAFRKPK
ncbi:LysR family transcriptional regulator [Azospirillum griseum]|uniref:LysR family transcriptional regulator n=1 Tax=Azospirillum griseum TaxID=2496639 RepID=A0A3S0HWU9_9PROT|nr:LysR family transcriptional regulator [Azospirillum griseum]RTR14597.1 LysR family transcriptional regulator [Azospirillum griseum]